MSDIIDDNMINGFLRKYILLILLLVNMTSEYLLLKPVSEIAFYMVFAISIPLILFNSGIFSGPVRIKFPELFGMIVVYLIAQFIFQLELLSIPNLLYTISKVAVFCIIALCINREYNFYLKKVPIIFSYIILVIIALGWVYNTHGKSTEMVTLGFVNRNVACTVATAGFAGFMFIRDKLKLTDYICLMFLFVSILYGGSRNALAMCAFIIIIKFGLSLKLVLFTLLLLFIIIEGLPLIGVEATALDRVLGTLDGSVAVDREVVRKIAWQMIEVRPWTGWGYRYEILPSIVASAGVNLNAHNGYLIMIENLGWPCGIAVLLYIIVGSIKRLKLYLKRNRYLNYHLAIVISTLFAANQEGYFIGVNQFTTNIFFMSFAVLGVALYKNRQKADMSLRV